MVPLMFLVAVLFAGWIALNFSTEDPMWLCLNRAWYFWASAFVAIVCAYVFSVEVLETWNSLRLWHELSAKMNPDTVIRPTDVELFWEAVWTTLLGPACPA
jgi:hypothetical protein